MASVSLASGIAPAALITGTAALPMSRSLAAAVEGPRAGEERACRHREQERACGYRRPATGYGGCTIARACPGFALRAAPLAPGTPAFSSARNTTSQRAAARFLRSDDRSRPVIPGRARPY
jgi:hypothetical protein